MLGLQSPILKRKPMFLTFRKVIAARKPDLKHCSPSRQYVYRNDIPSV